MKRNITGPKIKIKGQWVSLYVAPYAYVCEVCHSKTKRQDHGLKCTTNPDHRGFTHHLEAAKVNKAQQVNINELENVYAIVDGKVTVKCQL